MSQKDIKNVAASVRQRLKNLMERDHRTFEELLVYYAMERFLYRLSRSPHSQRFVLKGALMLTVWEAPLARPTRDIDLLGFGDNDVKAIVTTIREVCTAKVESDGIIFNPDSVTGVRIKEDADYEGVRVTFDGKLDTAKARMQIDVGFGDIVVPEATDIDYPTLLGHPAPHLRGYSMVSVVAEKFEALVQLDLLTSRMKDLHDICYLGRNFDFDGALLAQAIHETFVNRGTELTARPTVFTARFYKDADKAKQWTAFKRRLRESDAPAEVGEVVQQIDEFLMPVVGAIVEDVPMTGSWSAGSGWSL